MKNSKMSSHAALNRLGCRSQELVVGVAQFWSTLYTTFQESSVFQMNHFPRGLCLLGPRIQFSRPVQAVARGVAAAFPGDFVEPCMRVGCCLETSAAQPPQQTCLTARCFPFTNTPYTSNLSLQKSTLVVRDSTEQHFEIRQATRI